ncbi:MAG: hypothetical protein GWN58_58115, partial [Anaerolineae bacterium]|nr:hypothetical protein [Anaerolineae bacterium]
DREGAVYVSNQPKRLPILSKPQQSSQEFGAVAAAIEERNGLAPFVVEGANYEFYYT